MTPRRSQNGFMLLEAILALALVAAGLCVLIECLNRCLVASRNVQNYTRAEMLLANKSAEFRLDRGQDVLDQQGTFEEAPGFTWNREFLPTDTEGLWRQTLTVSWQEGGRFVSDSIVEYRFLPQKQR